jgi:hypothetical protein
MTIDELGSLGELIAAVATVLTLLYLARQIHSNTKATKAETSLSINEALANQLSAVRSDAEFAGIWLKGLKQLDSLNEVERIRFMSHALDILNLAQYVDDLEKQGFGDVHIDYIPWVATLLKENPGFKAFLDAIGEDNWAGSRDLYRRLTDKNLAKGANMYETGFGIGDT